MYPSFRDDVPTVYCQHGPYRGTAKFDVCRVTRRQFSHLIERQSEEDRLDKFAILALLEARPGREQEVEDFLKSAQPLAVQEAATTTWYAVKLGPARFGIFDTFQTEEGRTAHVTGEIAKALFARAEELFATPPQVEMLEILAAKAPQA
jgi:quinol monooxygenase YgiN